MCDCQDSGLTFIFHELSRKIKPCINLRNKEDAALLADALQFAKKHCIKLDGCCTSRVYARLDDLKKISTTSDHDLGHISKILKSVFQCEPKEEEFFCCMDALAVDTGKKGDILTW